MYTVRLNRNFLKEDTMSSTANFFSNKDPNLPNLNLKHLPRIKSSLPNIQMQGESDFLFDINGESVALSEVADRMGKIFFNS